MMKRQHGKWVAGAAALISGLGGAMTSSALDITIFDGQSSAATGWYSSRENNETEPGTITTQAWDLERMLINGTKLTIEAGYDFRTGAYANNQWYRRGDILIDLNGDAKTTWNGTLADRTSNGYFNYDFAVHFTTVANNLTYSIVDLNANSKYEQVTDIDKSNPWRLNDNYLNGSYIDGMSGAFNAQFSVLSPDAEGNHYALEVDLANFAPLLNAIKAANEALFKYTIECGNDTILGLASVPSLGLTSVPDSGATLSLLSLGLGSLSLVRLRRASRR